MLCEGGCKRGESNIVFSFPIHVGRKSRAKYKNTFVRDHEKIHKNHPNAPFKKKETRKTLTPCFITKISTVITPTVEITTESDRATHTSIEEITRSRCPLLVPGLCRKELKSTTQPEPTDIMSLKTLRNNDKDFLYNYSD